MLDFIYALGKDGLKAAYSALGSFALWLTVALAVVFITAYVIIKLRFKNKLASFKTLSLGIVVGYAVTLTACLSFFYVARIIVKDEINVYYYLVLVLFALLFIFAVMLTISKLVNRLFFKLTSYIGIAVLVIYSIVLLFVIPTESGFEPTSTAGLYIFSALLVGIITLLTIFFGKDKGTASPTKAIAYAGISIALAFALSYVKLFSLPNGGSVTLASMLPLLIYSYVFGARKGVLAGIIYGVLQFLQSPQPYHAMQILLDYPIAFGALGVCGIAKNFNFTKGATLNEIIKFFVGACIAVGLRYLSHVLSGYYVFYSWKWEGYSALTYSLVYNIFVFVDLAIILIVGGAIFSSKPFVKQLKEMNPDEIIKDVAEK